MMNGSTKLADVIRNGRRSLNLTQDDFAALTGCSRSLVASVESGSRCSKANLERIAKQFSEGDRAALFNTEEARRILGNRHGGTAENDGDDMISTFMKLRRSNDVDLSGTWSAIWLTTVNAKENRNREIVDFRRRWNGSWQLSNQAISEENPNGGYLWIARMEIFDNRHLLGYYCARERNILAKGTLCLELQPNGREILGTWDGLNFDTMWATGIVALTPSTGDYDPAEALERFAHSRPKMPYNLEK
jgi:transcriptional regulator with XRE-family HTH domain